MVLEKHVGFIGAGQMAEALARGFSGKGIVPADHMHCTDISKGRRDLFQELGAQAYEKAVQVCTPDAVFVMCNLLQCACKSERPSIADFAVKPGGCLFPAG